MNRSVKRITTYVRMSLLFMFLGAIVLLIAGEPLASYIISQGNMIIVKGAPGYPKEYNSDLSKLVMNKMDTIDQSEIIVPELETRLGDIACDRVTLTAPIYYGDSATTFQNGVGLSPSSSMPGVGKPILIGGHDGTFFAALESIVPGDVISITTNYGQIDYEVVTTQVAAATDITASNLSQPKEQLILYTCYPFGQLIGDRSDRYYVYCDRILDTEIVVQ